MIKSLAECAAVLALPPLNHDAPIRGFEIDSRRIQPGMCFLALDLARSGVMFVEDAIRNGAVAVITSQPLALSIPHLVVDDVEKAMLQLMHHVVSCSQAKKYAITGSMGKTTSKNALTHVLSQIGSTHATTGNLNNHFGVPVTLLNIQPKHAYVVIEMGANQPGDIAQLVEYAKPDVVVITNAAPCHLEKLHSIEGVIQEKGSICRYAPKQAVAFLPKQDRGFEQWVQDVGHRTLHVFNQSTTVWVKEGIQTLWQDSNVVLKTHVSAPHLLGILDLCVQVASYEGMSLAMLQQAFETFPNSMLRHRVIHHPNGCIIDDSYNASPEAVMSMSQWLSTMPGPGLVVLGHMAELGVDEQRLHTQVAAKIHSLDLDCYYLGDAGEAIKRGHPDAFVTSDINQLKEHIEDSRGHRSILIKGSRSSRMERVVHWLEESYVA